MISRQVLLCWRAFSLQPCMSRSLSTVVGRSPETALLRQLRAKILATGPLTVAEYMREALTNPVAGYYTTREAVLGQSGDFTTSPEISQLFGELLGVWCVYEWLKLGSPRPMQVVELGPGRGTLTADIMRVFKKFDNLGLSHVPFQLVEVSPVLQEKQKELLSSSPFFVRWYSGLAEVPRDYFTIFLAHEFFDALPIHKFQRTSDGWREVLVDIDQGNGPHHLRYVLSRFATPAQVFIDSHESRNCIEVSPESGRIVQDLSTRIEEDGGFALIVDYGHNGNKSDTFRGFRQHNLEDPLCEPGMIDMTADVDFSYLRKVASDKCVTFGPTEQLHFLSKLGIQDRLKKLLDSCQDEKQKEDLLTGCHMLLDSQQMGQKFKFFAMFPKVVEIILKQSPVVGFQ